MILVTMFATSEHGIVVQDVRTMPDDNCRLLGVRSPYIMVLNEGKAARLVMHDFEELGACDAVTKKAILDFCFYLSVANMDEAFKAGVLTERKIGPYISYIFCPHSEKICKCWYQTYPIDCQYIEIETSVVTVTQFIQYDNSLDGMM